MTNRLKPAETYTHTHTHTHTGKLCQIIFSAILIFGAIVPAMATPSNTSSTFPNDELMQADYTYTGQATYNNTGVYSGSVNANAEYEAETYQCSSGQYLAAGGTSCTACPELGVCSGGSYTYNANDDQGVQMYKFGLTTTNTTTSFQFSMTAVGTFTVNCGDGGTLSGSGVSGTTITRNNTTMARYTCTWGSAGAHTILFDGTATNYNTGSSTAAISFYVATDTVEAANAAKVASISGNLSAIFPYISGNAANGAQPRFYATFRSATSLTSIPATLFADYTTASIYMFYETFRGCTGLTSLPSDLFSKITSEAQYMFISTFRDCTGLTSLPSDLFSKITSGANYMFTYTFSGCTGLTTLPNGLFFPSAQSVSGVEGMFSYTFEGCTGLTSLPSGLFFPNAQSVSGATYMFANTFDGCTGLTSLPSDLFSKITSGARNMFVSTFRNCTRLTSLPNGLFFPNAQSVSGANYMFSKTFYGCTGLTSLPSDLFSKITSEAQYMFISTFEGCTGLTSLPSGLFFPNAQSVSGATNMFNYTFDGCTGLTSLPSDLFSKITSGASGMFASTFEGCTGLTSLPSDLFSKITSGAGSMFSRTFENCTNLGCETAGCSTGTGYIPPTLFAGITPRGSNERYTMGDTFYNTKLVTTCPSGMVQYTTGWEGSGWNNKVSCVPGCPVGQYSPSGSTSCSTCPANSFCPGFEATLVSSAAQGITACSTLDNGAYPNSAAGASVNTQCYTACTANDLNIEHAATASGNNYYGDGVDTCALATCVNGYHLQPYSPGLATIINNNGISNYAHISNSGEDYEGTASDYGLTSSDINVFVWDLGSAGIVRGHGRCSTLSSSDYESGTDLTDETGQSGARYCYCRVEQYIPSGGTAQSLTGAPWVYSNYSRGSCAEYCSAICAGDVPWDSSLTSAMLSQFPDTPAACIGNEITITWQGALQSDIETNNAGTMIYGGDINTPVRPDPSQIPTGMRFKGWRFAKPTPSGN